ncbi:MAG TPA: amidohydrolase family protein, partial [Longimicrobiaceae bacterium]|nr:amidohydrolase family protein [Longimicrobiaceae bacterium]
MIIDCHTHLNRYTPGEPPTLAERHAALRTQMDAHGIDHALVLTSYTGNEVERSTVEETLAQIADDPRLHVVAGIDVPNLGPEQLDRVRGHLQAGSVRGLKLYPGYQPFSPRDAALRPVYELAAEFRVPVMIHTGDTFNPVAKVRLAHPLEVDDVAVDFREVTFVICHLGNPWFADAMEVIYKNENVMGDICGLTVGEFQPRYERFALRCVNDVIAFIDTPDKLMFGTDWPISDIGSYLRFAERLEMTDEEREGLMWRNAARL